jgi:hypothetical protein
MEGRPVDSEKNTTSKAKAKRDFLSLSAIRQLNTGRESAEVLLRYK